MGKRGVPSPDTPEAPASTVRGPRAGGRRASSKKADGDFNAAMAVLRMSAGIQDPDVLREAVARAAQLHGQDRVIEALRAVEMPDEFLPSAVTTQDTTPVTSTDNSMPAVPQQTVTTPSPSEATTSQALPTPGTYTVKDLLAGRVAVPEPTPDTAPKVAADPSAENAGQPSPEAQQAAVEAVQEPARDLNAEPGFARFNTPGMTPEQIMAALGDYDPGFIRRPGMLDAAFGPGMPAPSKAAPSQPGMTAEEMMAALGDFGPAVSQPVPSPLVGLSQQEFPANFYDPSVQSSTASPSVRLINPVLPQANAPPPSMELLMRGLRMSEPSPDPGRLQAANVEGFERLPAGVEDGLSSLVVNTPRPGIKQMQESLQAAPQQSVPRPAVPKKSIYETLGMNPPASFGEARVYKNLPTALKAGGIAALTGAGLYGLGHLTGALGQDQNSQPGESALEAARRRLMQPKPVGFGR